MESWAEKQSFPCSATHDVLVGAGGVGPAGQAQPGGTGAPQFGQAVPPGQRSMGTEWGSQWMTGAGGGGAGGVGGVGDGLLSQ